MKITEKHKNRFWSKVDKRRPNECWGWKACKVRGYGQMKVNGRSIQAHRFSFLISGKKIPNGLFVLHSCDCRTCTNPNHLRLGTHKENMIDMKLKGRAASGKRNGKWTHPESTPRGEGHKSSKLKEKDIFKIREMAKTFQGTEIAKKFSVVKGTIYNILNGKSWKHI